MELREKAKTLFEQNAKIVTVVIYTQPWVPNAYKWRAPGTAYRYTKTEEGTIKETTFTYDRKRSKGKGPSIVGFSENNGRLFSK